MDGSLVITRKANESFTIGDSILVIVERVNGKRVKIRIIAPKDVTILRSEIANRTSEGHHAE